MLPSISAADQQSLGKEEDALPVLQGGNGAQY